MNVMSKDISIKLFLKENAREPLMLSNSAADISEDRPVQMCLSSCFEDSSKVVVRAAAKEPWTTSRRASPVNTGSIVSR